MVGEHRLAQTPVLLMSEAECVCSYFPVERVHIRAPDGLEHFTLHALAQELTRAFRDQVCGSQTCLMDPEEELAKYTLTALTDTGKILESGERELHVVGSYQSEHNIQFEFREPRTAAAGEARADAADAELDDDAELEYAEQHFATALTVDRLERSLRNLHRPDDVVIPNKTAIKVMFDYPFDEEHVIELHAPEGAEGFTRRALLQVIGAQFQAMYREESAAVSAEGGDPNARIGGACVNRMPTAGPWSISYHDLEDLVLHSFQYDKGADVYHMGIDS
jgi:hypothetical protein